MRSLAKMVDGLPGVLVVSSWKVADMQSNFWKSQVGITFIVWKT